MDPKDAVLKIEAELAETCGAMSKLIVSNAARSAGVEKYDLGSSAEYNSLLNSLLEPAGKFLGKTKAQECIATWKKLV